MCRKFETKIDSAMGSCCDITTHTPTAADVRCLIIGRCKTTHRMPQIFDKCGLLGADLILREKHAFA